jgi:hypothetical protein
MFVGNFNRYIKGHIIDILSCPLIYPFILLTNIFYIIFIDILFFFIKKNNKKKFNKNTKK